MQDQRDDMRSDRRFIRSITTYRELWRLLFLITLLFFLMHITPDVEMVIHKWATRF